MTSYSLRLLATAAAAAACVLAAGLTVRYFRHAAPGAIGVLTTCGRTDHRACPPRCRTWRRGFAVPTEHGLDLWHLVDVGDVPAYRIAAADLPDPARRDQILATDLGPVRVIVAAPAQGLVLPGPGGPRPAAFAAGGAA